MTIMNKAKILPQAATTARATYDEFEWLEIDEIRLVLSFAN